MEMTFTLRTS